MQPFNGPSTQFPCFRNSNTASCRSISSLKLFRVSVIVSTHIAVRMGAIVDPSRCGALLILKVRRPGGDRNHITLVSIIWLI